VKHIHRLVKALHLPALFILTGAHLSVFISPAKFWPLAFLGLAYLLILLINLLFLLYWLFFSRKWLIISCLVMSPALYFAATIFQIRLKEKPVPEGISTIRVMSYNVRLFDLYNWTKNKETRDSIVAYINEIKPDIIAIQEYYHSDKGKHNHTNSLKIELGLPYSSEAYTLKLRKTDKWGIAIFSRFPIIRTEKINFEGTKNNTCIYADLLINNDTIRVYNTHLQSVQLKSEDYTFLKSIGNDSIEVNQLEGSEKILRRLKRAFVKRSKQCESLAEHHSKSPHKVIVCGDFNDTPVSYTYHTIARNLNDAFVQSGSGLGNTYAGIIPWQRIDYILHSKSMKSFAFKRGHKVYSDHYPVYCEINIR
jgi:endonuclease/exonuclease/phosphatase family metal-dependent hydrolase